jgi:DNA-directed RNA polymerase specialized sigma24 family protein
MVIPAQLPVVKEMDARSEEMVRLRQTLGLTQQEIGDWYGASYQRVGQILRQHAQLSAGTSDVEFRKILATQRKRAARMRAARKKRAEILAAWEEERTPSTIARELGLSVRAVAQVILNETRPAEHTDRHDALRILAEE